MSQSPYEVLGVRKNATAKTVLKAYRRLAMQYHPDRNPGDAEAAARFEAVQRAYELLRDPARRKRYDETGDASEPRAATSPDAEVMTVLGPCLGQTVEQLAGQGMRAEAVDVVKYMRDWIRDATRQRTDAKAKAARVLKFYEGMADRLKEKTDGGEDLLGSVARIHVANLKTQVEQLTAEIALADRAAKYLDRYGYEFERMIAGRQVPAYGTMTTGYVNWFTV